MGCRNDYMMGSERETESHIVAKHIVYINKCLDKNTDEDIIEASTNPHSSGFGYNKEQDRLNKWTALLCSTIKSLTEEQMNEYVYNARVHDARHLADWWESHQEMDRRREKKEKEEKEREGLRKSGLAKLTNAEKKALGL